MLEVLEGGVECTVQDRGRSLKLHEESWAVAGAMDNLAFRLANLLVGNDPGDHFLMASAKGDAFAENPGDAALEVTLYGTKLRFHVESCVAVCGADLSATLNDEPVPLWTAVRVRPGDILEFGLSKDGMRAYVAVAGGLDTPLVEGSRSTFALMRIGGPTGKALAAEDRLPIGPPRAPLQEIEGRRCRADCIPVYKNPWDIRVIVGPEDDRYTPESIDTFFRTEWKVSPAIGRSAIRLSGPTLSFKDRPQYLSFLAGDDPSNIVDTPIAIGAIQTPAGNPIIIHCEGPTGGGYAKIATIISADLWKAAQARPGDRLRFQPVTIDEAYEALRAYRKQASLECIIGGA